MRLTIDSKPIDVEPGTTILQAAARLGIEIPTLCHMDGIEPRTSCFVCVVKLEGGENFTPACKTPCAEGMAVSSSSPEVAATRKTALELLLSDHAGACVASCSMACPADLDIPGFTQPLAAGDTRAAIEVIRRRLALPATLGYLCPGYCESACGRKKVDESVHIRSLHRIAAEADLGLGTSLGVPPSGGNSKSEKYPAEAGTPEQKSGKKVAIVGAGPAGLSAAFYLLQSGHDCTLFDAAAEAGGCLRVQPEEKLPRAVLDAEIALIERLGARFTFGWRLENSAALATLRRNYDAVLIAIGAGQNPGTAERKADLDWLKTLGFKTTAKGIAADKQTQATSYEGIFAAGEAATGAGQLVWAVAAGRNAAVAIDQYLSGAPLAGQEKLIYFRKQNTDDEEKLLWGGHAKGKSPLGEDPAAQPAHATEEAGRCRLCGCPSRNDCKLRLYATRYGASFNRFRGERRELAPDDTHPELVYDAGKCILCGLCVKIAEEAGEEVGLCFAGRGFTTRMTPALGANLAHGLKKSARAAAEACPTGALILKKENGGQNR